MSLFLPLYRRAMVWVRHPRAPLYLGGMSFAEPWFFPVPPDVMAPMCLAQPRCHPGGVGGGWAACRESAMHLNLDDGEAGANG